MTTTFDENAIIEKTKALCQTILDQPEFRTIRRHIDAFMADGKAQSQYQLVMEKGELLHQKQHLGMPLPNNDVEDYEKCRQELLNNAVAREFIDAQQEMHKVQQSVSQYVQKTFELGRLPVPDDFSSGCGSNCGCGH